MVGHQAKLCLQTHLSGKLSFLAGINSWDKKVANNLKHTRMLAQDFCR